VAHIDFQLQLNQFSILKDNESSADEPYLWVFHIRLDGSNINLLQPEQSFVSVTSAPGGSSNLGPSADGIEVLDKPIPVPASVGRFNGTLNSDALRKFNAALSVMEPFCSVASLVIALEGDASKDSDMEVARKKVRDELQLQLNANLRRVVTDVRGALLNGKTPPTQADIQQRLQQFDLKRFKDVVVTTVMGLVADDATVGAIGVLTGLFPPFGLAQVIDPDDFVGHAIVGPVQMSELISAGPDGVPFSLFPGSIQSPDGMYRITGRVCRTDSTEFAALALSFAAPTDGTGQRLEVTVRNSLRGMSRSAETPPTAKPWDSLWKDMPEGTFLSGPAVATSNDGRHVHVIGLGLDRRMWRARSSDAGASWSVAWSPIGAGTFLSAPAAAVSADGLHLHVLGRGHDNRMWHAYSLDGGISWPVAWVPIGAGLFNSAPAAAISDDGRSLHVVGRGHDNRMWRAHSANGGEKWNLAWTPVGTGTFLSGPAVVVSGDGHKLQMFGRGTDHRLWRAASPDGGAHWTSAWAAIPGGAFTSSPAAAMSPDGKQVHVAALGNDLHVWRSFSTDGGASWGGAWHRIGGAIGF
jgi:hypothetical protein